MKRFSEQFHKKANTISLETAEKRALRARVVSYMEYHPLPHTEVSEEAIRSPFFDTDAFQAIRIPTNLLFRASAMLTIFVLMVVPVLAERSVPGDSLYAIKVRFNEEVRGTLAFTPYQKIEWETERLNRRVAEARLLASEGRLTDSAEAEIAAAVKEHTDSVKAEIEELRTEDADEAALASIELATTLAVQSAALQEEGNTTLALAIDEAASGNQAQLVVDVLNESLSEQLGQVEATELPAYEKMTARLEQNTTRAYELLQSLGLQPEDQRFKDLSRRLEDVGRSMALAAAKRGDNEEAAKEELLQAFERTQTLIVFMSDEGNVGVDIETVVPIILTAEEEAATLAMLGEEVDRKSEILQTVKPRLSAGAAEKVTYTLEMVAANQITDGNTVKMKSLSRAKESVALLNDALKVVASEGVDIAVAAPVTEVAATSSATSTDTQEGE